MPRKSQTENVRKICEHYPNGKWKTCEHPWYLDFYRKGFVKRIRDNLDKLIGKHPADYAEAKIEARRAIVAKLDGRDPKGLVPSDEPTLAQILEAYNEENPWGNAQIPKINATKILSPYGLRPFGEWRAASITSDNLHQFKRERPKIAANRDLALLRAAFYWAVGKGLIGKTPFRTGDRGDRVAVSLSHEEARSRRLHPGEEERLLEASGGLHDIIVAALETGMRRGEILSLQWWQVRFSPRAEIPTGRKDQGQEGPSDPAVLGAARGAETTAVRSRG